ncbi:MAG: hypothetical protein E7302_06355 [Butyrivibrio sp.]|nr:hypothetical protein [Butyrivibrio sp.]
MSIKRKRTLYKAAISVSAVLLMFIITFGSACNYKLPSSEPAGQEESKSEDGDFYRNYTTDDIWAGTFRMDENGQILIRRGEVGANDIGTNNKMAYYEESEWSFELTDDVDIFLYAPVDSAEGAAVTREDFLKYLKEYQIDCYFHLNDDEKIDYILGAYYS